MERADDTSIDELFGEDDFPECDCLQGNEDVKNEFNIEKKCCKDDDLRNDVAWEMHITEQYNKTNGPESIANAVEERIQNLLLQTGVIQTTSNNVSKFNSQLNDLKDSVDNIHTSINNHQLKIKNLDVKRLYDKYKTPYSDYMYSLNTKNYARECINHNNRLFDLDVKNISSIKEKIYGDYGLAKRTNNSFRTFLTFLEERTGIDPEDIDGLRRYVKGGVDSEEDEYVPTIDEINSSIQKIKNTSDKSDLMLYYALVESGARWVEIKKMINEFSPSKHIRMNDEVSYYKLFWTRGKKKAFYLFFRTSTLDYIVDNLELFKKNPTILSNYDGRLNDRGVISTKYPRKTAFTQMIINGVQYNIADLFEGRSSTVSAKHYLGKEEVLVNEYEKYLNGVLKDQII